MPIGGDHGAYDGIEHIAAELHSLPDGSVLYDHWLSWQWSFYLFDSRVYVSWFQGPDALSEDLSVNGHKIISSSDGDITIQPNNLKEFESFISSKDLILIDNIEHQFNYFKIFRLLKKYKIKQLIASNIANNDAEISGENLIGKIRLFMIYIYLKSFLQFQKHYHTSS